MPFTPSHSD